MSNPKPVCERCGAPAVVHIGHDPEYDYVIRHFCMECAIAIEQERQRPVTVLNVPVLVVSTGLTVLLLSVWADALALGRAPGFGWKQDLGVMIGGALAVVGAVAVVRTVLVAGLQVAALCLLADWLRFGDGEGFGHHQLLGTAAGAFLILVGVAWLKRKSRPSRSSEVAPSRRRDGPRWAAPSLQAAGWDTDESGIVQSSSTDGNEAAEPPSPGDPGPSEK